MKHSIVEIWYMQFNSSLIFLCVFFLFIIFHFLLWFGLTQIDAIKIGFTQNFWRTRLISIESQPKKIVVVVVHLVVVVIPFVDTRNIPLKFGWIQVINRWKVVDAVVVSVFVFVVVVVVVVVVDPKIYL